MRDYSRFDLPGAIRRAQKASLKTHTPRFIVMNAIGYSISNEPPNHYVAKMWEINDQVIKVSEK